MNQTLIGLGNITVHIIPFEGNKQTLNTEIYMIVCGGIMR